MKLVTTILAVIGAIIMFISGVMKIVSSSFRGDMVANYAIGGNEIGGWFYVLVGIAEIGIAVWLIYPPFRDAGGVALFIVMLGAMIFNLGLAKDILPAGADDPASFVPINVVLGLVGAAIAFMWPRADPEAVAGTAVYTA